MREIFTSGSVGRAPGNRCLYPEADAKSLAAEGNIMQSQMMKNNKMAEKYWSRFADSYDKRQEYVVDKKLLDEITEKLDHLSALGEVVEFGCGTGYFTRIISQKSQSIMATDISDSLLEAAKKRLGDYPNVKVQQEDCMKTSFTAEAFDSVFMANLIHVVKSPAAVLQECHRILRKDGVLIIVTFTGYGMKLWEKIKMGLRFAKSWGKPPAHVHSFSLQDLSSIMEDTGFTIKISKMIGDNTKALYVVGQKKKTA